MIRPTEYNLYRGGEEREITIKPLIRTIPGGNMYATGVFQLHEAEVGLGDIVFDDNMNEWEYSGMGDLTHPEAEEIANFIKNYHEPNPEDRAMDENRIE